MGFSSQSSWICQFPISLAIEGETCYGEMAQRGIGRDMVAGPVVGDRDADPNLAILSIGAHCQRHSVLKQELVKGPAHTVTVDGLRIAGEAATIVPGDEVCRARRHVAVLAGLGALLLR